MKSLSRRFALLISLAFVAIPAIAGSIDSLSLVPSDAVSVGMIRIAQMRTSPLTSRLFTETDKISVDGDAKEFLQDAGLNPSRDIDTVFASMAPREGSLTEPNVLVIAEGRFDANRLAAAITARGAETRSSAGTAYYVFDKPHHRGDGDEEGAVAFLSSSLAIAGNEEAVVDALERRAAGGGSFRNASLIGRELHRLDEDATAWALVDVARAKRLGGARVPRSGSDPADALAAALKTVSIVGISGTNTGEALSLAAFGISNDAETRQLIEDTLRGLTAAWRLAAQEKAPELVSALRKFEIGQTSDSVTIRGTIPASVLKAAGQRMHQHAK